MAHTAEVTVAGFGTATVHFHSRPVGRTIGSRFQMTINPDTILDANGQIDRMTLAHEFGHREQAKARGWRYLPWVLWHYLKEGYENSLPERLADQFMYANAHLFPLLVRCPCGKP